MTGFCRQHEHSESRFAFRWCGNRLSYPMLRLPGAERDMVVRRPEKIQIRDFDCVTRMNTHTSSTMNAARSVAVYKHVPSRKTCRPLNETLDNRAACVRSFRDVSLAEFTVSMDQLNFNFLFALRVHLSWHCASRHWLSAVPTLNAIHSQSPVPFAVSKRRPGNTNTAVW
jgi:hypothetical protein